MRGFRSPLTLGLIFIVAGTLLGGALGSRASGPADIQQGMDAYGRLLQLLQERYVEPVEPKQLIYDSIRGMVRTLDPHSNFLDETSYSDMREEQRGEFFGLGIVISKRGKNNPLTVISPIDDTPAARLGIRAGDVITHVRDERIGTDTDTLQLTIQEAVTLLRGPRGTPVEITVERAGLDRPLIFEIVRDVVPTRAVANAYMIRPATGYVKLVNFTQTSTRELDEALDGLEGQGMERLILDLRDNPGGLLDQAIKVADRFVPGGEVIVSTRGRVPGSDQEFYATDRPTRKAIPMVVLVNGGSASASEIVAGAVQDHDRGLVVGVNTFGKGLVQSVYPLPQGTALALTTQKYYTPSGRLIQRDYSDFEAYIFERGETLSTENREARRTDGGRTVYGGGGITPDVLVEPEKSPPVIGDLLRQNAFFRFSVQFLAGLGPDAPEGEADSGEVLAGAFLEWAREQELAADLDSAAAAQEWVALLVRAEIAGKRDGLAGRDRVLAERDRQIQMALESFDEARQLADLRPGAGFPEGPATDPGEVRAQAD